MTAATVATANEVETTRGSEDAWPIPTEEDVGFPTRERPLELPTSERPDGGCEAASLCLLSI